MNIVSELTELTIQNKIKWRKVFEKGFSLRYQLNSSLYILRSSGGLPILEHHTKYTLCEVISNAAVHRLFNLAKAQYFGKDYNPYYKKQ
jgi:hypothetical protein